MDEMKSYEATELLNSLEYVERGEWERSRLLMWLNAQVNSTKKINVTDIMKFKWEQEEIKCLTDNDIAKIKNRMEHLKEIIKNKKE